jgi:membrane protein
VISAGVAFYFFLSLFPALAALISIYGLVSDVTHVEQQVTSMSGYLPEETQNLISNILNTIIRKSRTSLSLSMVVSLLFSLWSANRATSALLEGMRIAYEVNDDRGIIKKFIFTMLITLAGIIFGSLAISFIIGYPAIIDRLDVNNAITMVIKWLRWPILIAIIVIMLSFLYGFVQHRHRNVWFDWGTLIATIIWLSGSLIFTFYVDNFSRYDAMYGSFAAVIILMLWFFLTAFSILLGAEINSEIRKGV